MRSDNTVSILIGNGDGTFRPAVEHQVGISYPGENGPVAVAAGDFTGDGRLDLAVVNYNTGTVSILLGNGDGTFQPPVDYAVERPRTTTQIPRRSRWGTSTTTAGSTWPSSMRQNSTVSILLGNGDGTFQPAVHYSTGAYTSPDAIVVGDFNGDGKLDLAVADEGSQETIGYPNGSYQDINVKGGVSVLLGNGDGTFQPAIYDPVEAGRHPGGG